MFQKLPHHGSLLAVGGGDPILEINSVDRRSEALRAVLVLPPQLGNTPKPRWEETHRTEKMPLGGKQPWGVLKFSSSALPQGEGKRKEQRQACECLVPNHPSLFLCVLCHVLPREVSCSQAEQRQLDLLQSGSLDCISHSRTSPARRFNGEFLLGATVPN